MFIVKIINNTPRVFATQDIQKNTIWFESTDINSFRFSRSQYITLLNSEIEISDSGRNLYTSIKNYTLYDKYNDYLVFSIEGAGCAQYTTIQSNSNSIFINNVAKTTTDIIEGEEIINLCEYMWPEEWKCKSNELIVNNYLLSKPLTIPLTAMVKHKMYVSKCDVGVGVFVGIDCKQGDYSWDDHPHTYFEISRFQYELLVQSSCYIMGIFKPFYDCIILFTNYDHNVDKLILCLDNERYKNHSNYPNIDNSTLFTKHYTTFCTDIKAYTEIRESYFTYHNCPWANVYPSHNAEWIQPLKKPFILEHPNVEFF